MKKVSLITVNYNQPAATEALLESIISQNTYNNLEVIVVDNGSTENNVPRWTVAYPQFHFIRSNHNLGFAGGNNLGIAESNGAYLFFLNNDTIITPELIPQLVAFLDANEAFGVVSPKIHFYDPPEMLQYAGFTSMNFYTARNKCIGYGEVDHAQYDSAAKTTHYAHGAAMMMRRKVLEDVGPMPEIFFLYFEEMDWCEQIKRAGYKIGLCISALVYHKESLATGINSPLKRYYMNRNRLLFVRRNASTLQKCCFFIYFLTVLHVKFIGECIASRQLKSIPLFTKGLVWNLRNPSRVRVTN